MDLDTYKPEGKLRNGWTTGACASAAAKGAVEALLSGAFPKAVTINLPGGQTPSFALMNTVLENGSARAGVLKDAGDDPDVTHGAEIVATVSPGEKGAGVMFRAGEGVGTVTLPGLPVPVGEPAINPMPRQMIMQAIGGVAEAHGVAADFVVTLSIPGGEALAQKTMNPRLGIVGGLSVLGTTGIVKPYSCSAWIHAIHSGVDVARATGLRHIAAATGKTSETAIRNLYRLPESALIDMGDFAGGLLKYLKRHPVEKLTLAGGFAKLTKLSQGHMDLHSSRSELNFAALAETLKGLGADADTCRKAAAATTAMGVLEIAGEYRHALGEAVARMARDNAQNLVGVAVAVEVCVFDRAGELVGRA